MTLLYALLASDIIFAIAILLLTAGCTSSTEDYDKAFPGGVGLGGVAMPVEVDFPDTNLETAIREATGKKDGAIYRISFCTSSIFRYTNHYRAEQLVYPSLPGFSWRRGPENHPPL